MRPIMNAVAAGNKLALSVKLCWKWSLQLVADWWAEVYFQTVVSLISGSLYIRPDAAERTIGGGAVCGHGNVPWPRL